MLELCRRLAAEAPLDGLAEPGEVGREAFGEWPRAEPPDRAAVLARLGNRGLQSQPFVLPTDQHAGYQ